VDPEHLGRSETHGEVIAERPRLPEKLHVAGMQDIVTTGDEDADHDGERERESESESESEGESESESWELRDESLESRARPQTVVHPRDPHHPRSRD
jgi:hypothetical protein